MRYLSNREYSFFLISAGLTHTFCGWVSYFFVDTPEPWWSRVTLLIPCLYFAVRIYKSDWPEVRVRRYLYFFLILASLQYIYYTALTGYNYFYACGLFSVIAVGIIIINSKNFLIAYTLLFNLLATVLLPIYDKNQFYLLLPNLYFVSGILFYFQNQKIAILTRLGKALDSLSESRKEVESIYSLNLQVAHDLGSPISAISAVADLVKKDNPQVYQILERSMNRIKGVSSDLLSSHKENHSTLESYFFNLEKNIASIVKEKREEFDQKNLYIFYRISSPILHNIKLPRSEFYRVFSNLINNSMDAMENQKEKKIHIEITPKDSFVQIDISDNGRGIDPKLQDQIFLENVTTKENGTGLGLSFVKKAVSKWGGDILLLKSTSAGTCFRMIIPSR